MWDSHTLCEIQTDLSSTVSPQIKHQLCMLQCQYAYLSMQRVGKGWSIRRVVLFVLHLQKLKGLADCNSFRPTDSDHTLNDLWFFCPSSSLQQVNYVVNESYSVIQKVTSNLDGKNCALKKIKRQFYSTCPHWNASVVCLFTSAIGPQLGTAIQQQIKGVLFSALYPVRLLNQGMWWLLVLSCFILSM